METKKIAIACFVGGVVGTVIALICAPMLWWLGMLAGFGVGYLCYDLKEVREMVPVAWRTTKKGSGLALTWLAKPHPFLLLYMIISSLLFRATLLLPTELILLPPSKKVEDFFAVIFFFTIFFLILSFSLTALLVTLAEATALARQCFWENYSTRRKRERLLQKNYRQIPTTYSNIYGLILKGLMDMIVAAAKGIRIGVPALLRFLFWDMWVLMLKFLWILFKLIHSQKRVLCGIDSAIGTAITYFSLGINATTPAEKVMVIVCGGIIGAVVGILNFEIVSKRILRLIPT